VLFRSKTLGMPPAKLGNILVRRIPFLYNFSKVVVPQPPDWPDWIHTTGYWFLDSTDNDWTPPASLLAFIEAAKRNSQAIVYIGFGSIEVPDPVEMTKVVVEAVKRAGVVAVLCKRWSGKDEDIKSSIHESFPDYIYSIDKIPHDWLFPRVAAVVHHGGAGTTAASLRAGKPTIIKAYFGDQMFWSERLNELGVGIAVKKLTVTKLSNAISRAVRDTTMREKATLLGRIISEENGVAVAVQCIYRDLDFARDSIMKLRQSNLDADEEDQRSQDYPLLA